MDYYCCACGKSAHANWNYCPYCSASLQEPAAPQYVQTPVNQGPYHNAFGASNQGFSNMGSPQNYYHQQPQGNWPGQGNDHGSGWGHSQARGQGRGSGRGRGRGGRNYQPQRHYDQGPYNPQGYGNQPPQGYGNQGPQGYGQQPSQESYGTTVFPSQPQSSQNNTSAFKMQGTTDQPQSSQKPEWSRDPTWENMTQNTRKEVAKIWLQKVVSKELKDQKVVDGLPAQKSTKEEDDDYMLDHYDGTPDINKPWVFVCPVDTLMGAYLCSLHPVGKQPKVAVLNFADRYEPGGKLLYGATTHEESLCMRSTLYLSINPRYFDEAVGELNLYPLEDNELLYSKDVKVLTLSVASAPIPDGPFYIDVVSCGAQKLQVTQTVPTGPRQRKHEEPVYDDDASSLMRSKLEHILRKCLNEEANMVVLGAFGCEVHKHPAKETAQIMQDVLLSAEHQWRAFGLERVVIAVLDEHTDQATWKAFADVFKDTLKEGIQVDHDGSWSTGMIYNDRVT